MSLGDALYIGGFIVLPIAIVGWCLSQLRRLRNHGFGRRPIPVETVESTAELPVIPGPDGEHLTPPGADPNDPAASHLPPPVRRDWAEAIQPTRGRQAVARATAAAGPERPFSPPIYAGRSAGVVLRATPPAKRWPLAHLKAPHAAAPRSNASRRRPSG